MANLIADSCIHKPVCFSSGGGGCVSKCGHYINVENFTSHNKQSTPCPKCGEQMHIRNVCINEDCSVVYLNH